MADDITETKQQPPHIRIDGATFYGPDTSGRGIIGTNAGKAKKDVRRFSSTAMRACKGVVENS